MGEDHSRRIELQGPSDNHPRIDARSIDSAPEEPLKGYQAVLAVQEHRAEVFIFFLCDLQLTELLHIGGAGENLGISYPGFKDAYGLPDGSLLRVNRP